MKKKPPKKTKNDIIEVGKSEEIEEETTRINWNFFEMHHLIAIWGKMDEEFVKIANKEGNFLKQKLCFNLIKK